MLLPPLRKKLLRWYKNNKRDLPWRSTQDPYKIWISEVMLQQTRVSTVIPYYNNFLKVFPNTKILAHASEESLLKSWEGLGYYSRARNLKAAACELVEKYEGNLPSSSTDLRRLPGFGPYTSAAVGSIAFDEPIAVVDGNVRRVLSRLFATKNEVEELAQEFLDSKYPGDFNQSVMELGALICLPKNPTCSTCPLSKECQANQKRSVHHFPPKRAKPTVSKIWSLTLVLQHKNRYLVCKRPEKGRWGGMWEFPTVEQAKPLSFQKGVQKIAETLNVSIENATSAGSFRHQLSHQAIYVRVGRAKALEMTSKGEWVTEAGLAKLPLSRLQQEARSYVGL